MSRHHRLSSASLRRATLLAGTSLLALLAGVHHPVSAAQLGGGVGVPATTYTMDAAAMAAQQAAAAAQQSQSAMRRSIEAIQAMQGAQAAARAAAAAAQRSATLPQITVPNGLGAGGLQVAPSGTWSGASAPVQSAGGNGTLVTINQTAQQAILSWQSFNVGAQTTVNFNQPSSTATALNRVIGNAGPSQILGQIAAPGRVLIINQNGIIFGGASQINVGSLIASTANITDQQFQARGIYSVQSGSAYLPSFTGAGGQIVVEKGALITTNPPVDATSGGGFVALLGSSISNAGAITTPKGQALLAAGDDFILRPGYGTNANQYSTTNGNEVAPVIYAGSASGAVTNTGLMFAQQGDITLAGRTVVQDGALLSSTSVNQRGTIHLLNSASDPSGSITLTANSLTLVLPELRSTDTALNSRRDTLIAGSGANALATGQFDDLSILADRQDQSRIEIVSGGLVNVRSGSQTMAQGGQIAVSAGKRVFTENGATVDVSGVQGVVLPMSANSIKVNIQGNELRDSPQNRDNGGLFSQNVWIDARSLTLVPAGTGGYASDRYYTSGGLLEVSGYVSNTPHTIGEWSAVGGTIALAAPEVVTQQGSTFNISGGSVTYQGGFIPQSYVLGSDGRIYNVNSAPSNLNYTAVVTGFVVQHNQGGKLDPALTEIYASPLGFGGSAWQGGYTVGRDAGRLIISAPTAVFEGQIVADVIKGTRQVNARPAGMTDGYKLTQGTAPLAGTLALGQYGGFGLIGAYGTDVRFGTVTPITSGFNATDALPAQRQNTAWFDVQPINNKLGGLNIATGTSITVDQALSLTPGGQITFAAPSIALNADVTARGGNVTLGNLMHGVLGVGQATQWWALTNGAGVPSVAVAGGVTIDLRGLWSNTASDPTDTGDLAFINGGSLSVSTTGSIALTKGSLVDVSSGGGVLINGQLQGGSGGSVSLITNDYSHLGAADYFAIDRTAPLVLDGSLRAYGFNGGGSLTLAAGQQVVIGSGIAPSSGTLGIDPVLFSSGFTQYGVTGRSVVIAAGT